MMIKKFSPILILVAGILWGSMGLFVRSAREGRTKPMRGEPSVRALRTWQANRESGPAPKARSSDPYLTGGGVEKTRTFNFMAK